MASSVLPQRDRWGHLFAFCESMRLLLRPVALPPAEASDRSPRSVLLCTSCGCPAIRAPRGRGWKLGCSATNGFCVSQTATDLVRKGNVMRKLLASFAVVASLALSGAALADGYVVGGPRLIAQPY